MKMRLLLAFLSATVVPVTADTNAASESGEQIALGYQTLRRAKVEAAYERVWSRYAYVSAADSVVPIEQVGARKVEGKVVAFASGRRVIVEEGGQKSAIMLQVVPTPRVGDRIRLVARPASSPYFSWAPSPEQRMSLANLEDCTMTFDVFVRQIRRGVRFAEAPELGERPKTVNSFGSGQNDGKSMAERAADRLQKLPAPGSAFPEPPPLIGAEEAE